MTKIYRESFRYFLSSLPALLAFAVLIEVLLWFMQPRSESSVSFVGLTIVAYFFHRHFLFGESLTLKLKPELAEGAPPPKFGWFLLISGGLVLVPVGVAVAIAFQFPERQVVAVMLFALFPLYLLALSLFGTALPAVVVRDGAYKLSQGTGAVFGTMWRLIAGPGVVGLVLLAAALVGGFALESTGLPEDSLLVLAYYILVRTLGFLTTIFAVAVLCEMYRLTRPDPQLGQGPVTSDQTPA